MKTRTADCLVLMS